MFGLFKNFRFNPGGIFGALFFVAATILLGLYLMRQNVRLPIGGFKVLIFAGFGGGLFGNWLWRLAFGADNWEPPQRFEINDPDRRLP